MFSSILFTKERCEMDSNIHGAIIRNGVLIRGTSRLTEIPEGVTAIADEAFSGCDSLYSVTIPSSVTSIGDYAFEYCTSLEFLTIPSSVKTIGAWSFLGCESLTLEHISAPSSLKKRIKEFLPNN